ncbi:hypothetical protein B0T21DRAFT_451182 [Apiosordaria backusii]|uniref:DUF8021 domain-containing protein n=1 Tax=Apiosordaria backusii TaxID=314023 RepID=A0AA40BLN8_9PEZI|nr:hypothetical protein B0T21DRAFT_451182 [Apiosordaria backusii]
MVSRLLLSLLPLSGVLGQRCQWSHLRQSSDRYSELQTAPQHASLPPDPLFFPTTNPYPFYDNAVLTPLNHTILATSQIRPLHTHSIVDQEGCSGYTRLISSDAILGVHIYYESANNTGGTQEIQNNVKKETWRSFSRTDQDTRQILKSVFDGYLDGKGSVVWGESCSVLDSGKGGQLQAAQGEQCAGLGVGSTEGREIQGRKYVIDETIGAVSVLGVVGEKVAGFEGRIVKGRLEYVHRFGYY